MTKASIASACALAACARRRRRPRPRRSRLSVAPITLLVPFPPGGSADVVIRPVAAKVADALKQPIVIDNRSGGGGNIAAQVTKQAAPDGYTLFLTNMGVMSVNPILTPGHERRPGQGLPADHADHLVSAHPGGAARQPGARPSPTSRRWRKPSPAA